MPALMAPVLAMWILAAMTLLDAEPAERGALFLGKTWAVCPFLIALLATPVLAATLWAMRGLAPTRLRLAGAAAGLLSGASGALVYCFHCPELEAPFIAFWYLLGILIPTVIGTVFGDKLLRWWPRTRRGTPIAGLLFAGFPLRMKKRVRSAHP